MEWGPSTFTQLHSFVVSYTWDVPNGSRMWDLRGEAYDVFNQVNWSASM